ncbi:MAG: 16S rRNA (guanine(527)-N(7))-methyltransferase RsmG [Chitinophagales bacterium]|nr:16S rRNA (guanine(527)-N(7))-methyltransferase RsmG [Chitinophagales bacterium]
MEANAKLISKYFPQLTASQLQQFSSLQNLYVEWNEKINVISRKDIDHLYERHVLHSLAIAKFISFNSDSKVLDLGTGGGYPGIPLAILFPEVRFHLVDSIGKKIKVVKAIAEILQLKNVVAEQKRGEELRGKYDFIVSRAVAPMKIIYEWTNHLIEDDAINTKPNGWILLKGGDLKNEIVELGKEVKVISVSDFFEEEFFKEKMVVYFS